jgi:hypothetical protein
MKNDDIECFAKFWNDARSMYSGKQLEPGAVRMAFLALSSYTIDEVRGGLMAHIADTTRGQYAPKPADIIHGINSAKDKHWDELITMIGRRGPYQSVTFTDSRIASGVRAIGGWYRVNSLYMDELLELRESFYSAIDAAQPGGDATLLGIGCEPDDATAKLSSLVGRIGHGGGNE